MWHVKARDDAKCETGVPTTMFPDLIDAFKIFQEPLFYHCSDPSKALQTDSGPAWHMIATREYRRDAPGWLIVIARMRQHPQTGPISPLPWLAPAKMVSLHS